MQVSVPVKSALPPVKQNVQVQHSACNYFLSGLNFEEKQ